MGQRARAALILALVACGEPPRAAAPAPAPPATPAASVDASAQPALVASIACGAKSCAAATEYCDSGDAGAACKPLPSACASNRTCACLKGAGVTGTICDDTGGQIVNATR